MKERKTLTDREKAAFAQQLQWGRSGEGAEDRPRAGPRPRRRPRFNGAAPVKERKTRIAGIYRESEPPASMGPLR